jgi:hypothetical protein
MDEVVFQNYGGEMYKICVIFFINLQSCTGSTCHVLIIDMQARQARTRAHALMVAQKMRTHAKHLSLLFSWYVHYRQASFTQTHTGVVVFRHTHIIVGAFCCCHSSSQDVL